jgi:DNA-binding transcriptional regulator GbsR (MarR family)
VRDSSGDMGHMAKRFAVAPEIIQLADELGVVFADAGIPDIAGRILGWLLVSDPPEQSLEQLRIATRASKASISTMTRLLHHLGFIERSGGSETRSNLYKLRDDPWTSFSEKRLETTRRLVRLARNAEASLSWMPATLRRRIEQMSEFWGFVLDRNESLIEEWKRSRSGSDPRLTRNPGSNKTRKHHLPK